MAGFFGLFNVSMKINIAGTCYATQQVSGICILGICYMIASYLLSTCFYNVFAKLQEVMKAANFFAASTFGKVQSQ